MPAQHRRTTPEPMLDKEILNIDGAAALLGVSIKTFSKVLREGEVPGRKVGREWKFSRTALIAWVGSSRSRAFLDIADEPAVRRAAPPAPARVRRAVATPALRAASAAGGAGDTDGARAESQDGGSAARRRKPADDFSVEDL